MMIVTDLQHATQQVPMTPYLQKAIDFLRGGSWREFPEGRFEVDGHKIWGLVQCYETLMGPPERLEVHRKHVDLHLIVSGEETIGWIPSEHLAPDDSYDEERDVGWGTVSSHHMDYVARVRLRAGQLAVFFPSDSHLPRQAGGMPPAMVEKILTKVAIPG
jgi:biofilm protein TabA